MIGRILSFFGIGDQNLDSVEATRRRAPRFPGVPRVHVTIEGRTFSVKDWSQSGMRFDDNDNRYLPVGDEFAFIKSLAPGDELEFTLHIQLPDGTIDLNHKGRVVRSQYRSVAARFAPLTAEARRLMLRAIDGMNAHMFLESQTATA